MIESGFKCSVQQANNVSPSCFEVLRAHEIVSVCDKLRMLLQQVPGVHLLFDADLRIKLS